MIDHFSSQFEFFIDKRRIGRETIYGKILTTIIATVSLLYMIYLGIQLKNNEILPKIVDLTTLNEEFNIYKYEYSPVSFDIMINGK